MRSFLNRFSRGSSAQPSLLSVVSRILVGVYGDVNAYCPDYGSELVHLPIRSRASILEGLLPDERAKHPSLSLEAAEPGAFCPAVALSRRRLSTLDRSPTFAAGPPPLSLTGSLGDLITTGRFRSNEEVFIPGHEPGGFFSDAENMHRSTSPLSVPDIAQDSLSGEEPLGNLSRLTSFPTKSIVVLEPRIGPARQGQSADKVVMVPYRTYHNIYPQDDENGLAPFCLPGPHVGIRNQESWRSLSSRARTLPYIKPDILNLPGAQQLPISFCQITASWALLISVIRLHPGLLVVRWSGV